MSGLAPPVVSLRDADGRERRAAHSGAVFAPLTAVERVDLVLDAEARDDVCRAVVDRCVDIANRPGRNSRVRLAPRQVEVCAVLLRARERQRGDRGGDCYEIVAHFILILQQLSLGPRMVTARPSRLAAASAAALLLALRSAGACSVLPSTKYNNSDFVDGDGPRQADSLDECSGLCASMAACAFYSFQVDPSVNGTSCRWATLTHCCWLHTSAANAIADPTFTSGAVFDGSACPPPPGPCTAAAEGDCGTAGSRFCHCEWNATGRISPPSPPFCAISSSPYPLPDNRSIAALVAPQTPLQPNTRVAFFGDSLTWLGLYEEVLTDTLTLRLRRPNDKTSQSPFPSPRHCCTPRAPYSRFVPQFPQNAWWLSNFRPPAVGVGRVGPRGNCHGLEEASNAGLRDRVTCS